MYSHCELSLPSAGDQLSELDHFVDGSEFLTRDLSKYKKKKSFVVFSTSRFVPAALSSVELIVRIEDKTLQTEEWGEE